MRASILAAVCLLGFPAAALAAAWEMRTTDDGGVEILHDRAAVVTAKYVFWGANWSWVHFDSRLGTPDVGGAVTLAARADALKLKIDGRITRPAPNTLVYTYQLDAAEERKGIIGGGVEFVLGLDSASFATPPGEPVLLEDNRGWKWPAAQGQAVTVAFAPPLASVYFERGQKRQIRAMMVGADLAKGTNKIVMTVTLPEGGRVVKSAAERYGPVDTPKWHPDAMAWNESPVDVSFLNNEDKPAGRHGFVKAQGDGLVYEDGTPARFWGGNIAAYALFVDKDDIRQQARRIARLGFNLMRIHHHDSMTWVSRPVIDKTRPDSQTLDAEVMDRLDWWIKCLRDEGVYVWLDLHVGRQFKEGDALGEGAEEILRHKGEIKGFGYFSPRVQELMKEFNARYLGHVNPYTKLAYKDDPAVMGLLLTNENDLTHHFGNLMLGDKGNPVFNRLFLEKVKEFCAKTGLAEGETGRTWVPGPSKIFLNHQEHLFNQAMLGHLATLGVKVPVATTNFWGDENLYALPALAESGIVDAHSYGGEEELSRNPRAAPNFVTWIGAGQIEGKPFSVTEWNTPYPAKDRCCSPLYVASIARLQGWDAPMIYNYSQRDFKAPNRPDTWSTFYDPALAGMMPAAAVAFRQGHVSPARQAYCLKLSREQAYAAALSPRTSATLRTLVERSRVTVGLPATKELDWLRETQPAAGVEVVTDPNRDFIPAGQDYVESDTGELRRDWARGIQTVNTPKTQAAAGWIGGQAIRLKDVALAVATPKAAVAVTSLDGAPVASSKRMLITVMARVVENPDRKTPYLSEPVAGTLTITSQAKGLKLVPLAADGKELAAIDVPLRDGAYVVTLPPERGTHWFLLAAPAL